MIFNVFQSCFPSKQCNYSGTNCWGGQSKIAVPLLRGKRMVMGLQPSFYRDGISVKPDCTCLSEGERTCKNHQKGEWGGLSSDSHPRKACRGISAWLTGTQTFATTAVEETQISKSNERHRKGRGKGIHQGGRNRVADGSWRKLI